MALNFERGSPDRPRGHAFIYFTDGADPEQVAATYIVVLPVAVDFTKYMPPFLAGQVPDLGEGGVTAFAFPPAPEKVPGVESVRELAEHRDDDVIYAGAAALTDVMQLMGVVGQIVDEYGTLCSDNSPAALEEAGTEGEAPEEPDVDDVVYGMMSEADQLGELTRLIGRLRYAAEGGDEATAEDSEKRIKALGRHMPPNRQVDRLLAAALLNSPAGPKLAQLYLERAYSLLREDYLRVKAIDGEIQSTEAEVQGE